MPVEHRELLERILLNQERTMAAIDDLNAAVAANTAAVTAVQTAVNDLVAAEGTNDDTAVEAATTALNANTAILEGLASSDPVAPVTTPVTDGSPQPATGLPA